MASTEVAWIKLELDLADFDGVAFADVVPTVEASGIRLASMASLGSVNQLGYQLYELNAECSADIPGRGPFHTWDEYQRVRLESPSFDASGIFLALDDDRWVGMSGVSHREGYDYAFSEMTGTVRSHRGRGIAIAMKLRTIEFAQGLGVSSIRTVHHPANAAMISLNIKLGFTDASFTYPIR